MNCHRRQMEDHCPLSQLVFDVYYPSRTGEQDLDVLMQGQIINCQYRYVQYDSSLTEAWKVEH